MFEEEIKGKKATIWAIDNENNNPYRLYQKLNVDKLTEEQIETLRKEGELKAIGSFDTDSSIQIKLTANSTFLITIE